MAIDHITNQQATTARHAEYTMTLQQSKRQRQSYGVARKDEQSGLADENTYENDQMRSLHKSHANAAQNECEITHAPIISADYQIHEIRRAEGSGRKTFKIETR